MSRHSYRAVAHTPVPAWRRWLPIARHEWSSLFSTRWGVALSVFCLVPGLARLIVLLLVSGVIRIGEIITHMRARTGPVGLDPDRIDFYLDPVLDVRPGLVFFLLLSSVVVARAIARDRATNALELLWTRGVSPRGYLLGKWLGPFLLVSMMTVVVPLALWLTAVLLADDWARLATTWLPMLRALSGLTVFTAILVAIGVLLSALPATANAAVVLWSMLLVGSKAIGWIFAAALHQPSLRTCLSVWDAGGLLVRAMAGLPAPGENVSGAVLMLTLLTLSLAWCARKRLRLEAALA